MNPPETHNRLMEVLDEWQPKPELSPGFDAQLRRRIMAAGAAPRPWWMLARLQWAALAAVLLLAAGTGWYAHVRDARPTPAAPAVIEAEMVPAAAPEPQLDPVMRDLQLLNRDGDLIDHLDFLSADAGSGSSRVQDKD